jgi:inner membrane transporter RhtA
MNVSFYIAIEHLPLGTAVAIEFLGPVAVAGITGRGWRDRVGIGLAAGGVVLLAGVQLDQAVTGDAVVGLVAILGAAVSWAGYILLGRRVAVRRDGISSLAVGMAAGSLVWLPLAFGAFLPVVTDPVRAVAVVGVAVLSSVIPYVLEQLVLRRVTAARFAILLAMLPVTAVVIGAVLLAQIPTVVDLLGIALVCVAIVLSGQRPARPDEPENPLPA